MDGNRRRFPPGQPCGVLPPNTDTRANLSRETAAQILMDGARLWGFTEEDFQKADQAAARRKNPAAAD